MRALLQDGHGLPPPHLIFRILHPSQARFVIVVRLEDMIVFLLRIRAHAENYPRIA